MIDLKIIAIRDLLDVQKVEEVSSNPRTLSVLGSRYLEATEVLINGVEAGAFTTVSDTKILAQVPSLFRNSTITSVSVIAEQPSTNRSSILQLDATDSVKSITGLEKLVQFFTKILLQTPGTDIYNPEIGGGLLTLIGTLASTSDSRRIASSAINAVNKAREDVLRLQNKNTTIPMDEKLLTAKVDSASFSPAETALDLRVILSAVSGRDAVANLSL